MSIADKRSPRPGPARVAFLVVWAVAVVLGTALVWVAAVWVYEHPRPGSLAVLAASVAGLLSIATVGAVVWRAIRR